MELDAFRNAVSQARESCPRCETSQASGAEAARQLEELRSALAQEGEQVAQLRQQLGDCEAAAAAAAESHREDLTVSRRDSNARGGGARSRCERPVKRALKRAAGAEAIGMGS